MRARPFLLRPAHDARFGALSALASLSATPRYSALAAILLAVCGSPAVVVVSGIATADPAKDIATATIRDPRPSRRGFFATAEEVFEARAPRPKPYAELRRESEKLLRRLRLPVLETPAGAPADGGSASVDAPKPAGAAGLARAAAAAAGAPVKAPAAAEGPERAAAVEAAPAAAQRQAALGQFGVQAARAAGAVGGARRPGGAAPGSRASSAASGEAGHAHPSEEPPAEPAPVAEQAVFGAQVGEPSAQPAAQGPAATAQGAFGLRAGIGRQADALRSDLAVPSLRLLALLADARRGQLQRARAPLKCIPSDARRALQETLYDDESLRLRKLLDDVIGGLETDAGSLLERFGKADEALKDGAACLRRIADARLSASQEETLACVRGARGGIFSAPGLLREVRGLRATVSSEWSRVSAGLARIAADPFNPSSARAARTLAGAGGWVAWFPRHLDQAAGTLGRPFVEVVAPKTVERFAARSAVRRDELKRVVDPFSDLSRQAGVLHASGVARAALFDATECAGLWARIQAGQPADAGARLAALADAVELSIAAFMDTMATWRELLASERSARVQ